jgi:hypothetical protein
MAKNAALVAALDYLRRGWSVIPLRPRDKRPLVKWEGFSHARASEAELRQWFERRPDANVGVVTGAVSGLLVLDIDAGHGGEESLARLERDHGPLPATVAAETGGGGRHLYFAHPGGAVVGNRAGLMPGIDLRGDGGYVVAPPSVHPSGRAYRWRPGQAPDALPVAPLPAWLEALLAPRGERHGHPLAYWRRLVVEGVAEGARNTTIASFAGHLLWHGVDPAVVLQLLLAWNQMRCRPPLDDDEVARIVDSISRLHQRERDRG